MSYVFLGQINLETLENFTRVATESAEKGTISVHDNETELLIGLKELAQSLGVELVVAKIERGVDRLEGFKVNINLALLSFRRDDFTAVDNQSIRRNLVVQLQTLLRGCNGRQDGKTIHSRLDVGRGALHDVSSRASWRLHKRQHTYSSANIFAAREI